MSSRSVYGTIILTVSRKTAASSKGLAILESYYEASDDRYIVDEITLKHRKNGNQIKIRVHNVKISWNEFEKGRIKNESI
ncbi:hypothetical protein J41TS2_29670 [Bacillus sonorensis]|uniref:hypothetical protein n=1 Tax=Bacillus sonorensis TaxID=119858 RepID=UPI001B1FFC21|nr:hypothetical protein [Bacillus sonorensis]GIN67546.1 hypothetical protein J41TS2_29670 [Bacillus sonorensis]